MINVHSNFQVQINISNLRDYFDKYSELHKKLRFINFLDINYEEDYAFESKIHKQLNKELIEKYSKNEIDDFNSFEYYIKEFHDCDIDFDEIEDYYYDDSEYHDYHFNNIGYHYSDFDPYIDDFSYLKTFFLSKHHLWKMSEYKKALINLEKNLYSELFSDFKAEQTFTNIFLIKIEYFEEFIGRFKKFPFINWSNFSSTEYYPWTLNLIQDAQFVLDWNKVINNNNIKQILLQNEVENFKYFFELNDINIDEGIKEENFTKKIFIIKEYSGNLNEYFKFKIFVNHEINKNKFENIYINWLDSYATPFDIMNQEKLIFDVKDYDFVLLLEDENNLPKISQMICDLLRNNQIEIHTDIRELLNL